LVTEFLSNRIERLKKITELIRNARNNIYLLSELSPNDVTTTDAHKDYIKALNKRLEKAYSSTGIEIVRFVVVSGVSEGGALEEEVELSPSEAYAEQFKLLKSYSEVSLQAVLKKLPGLSLLLIDDRYIIYEKKHQFEVDSLNKIFDGGFFTNDKQTAKKVKNCFDEIKMHARPVRLVSK